jgi:phosphotransferase system  glucose/maltose/N-acetylglucosamine-specific IIC component
MISARVTGLFRFVIGILLLQGATALLTYTALMTDLKQTVWLFAAIAAFLGLMVALWFDSIISAVREQAVARQHKRHTREREKLKVQAERDRAKLAAQKKKAMGGAGLRTGVAVGGVVGVGVAMMFAQFMTLGLLTVAGAGGAALGYTVRSRQERRIRAREAAYTERLIVDQSSDVPRLESQSGPANTRRRKKPDAPA